jgi:hypothetical protein
MSADLHKPGRGIVGDFGLDERGRPVPIVWPEFSDGAEPEEAGAIQAAADFYRRCLLFITEGGHADAAQTRAAAVGVMGGVYASPSAAAKALGIEVSTIIRAVAKLRAEIFCNELRTTRDVKPSSKD